MDDILAEDVDNLESIEKAFISGGILKLLMFSYDFPPHLGGISRLCGNIVKQWRQNGEEVAVLTEEASSQPLNDQSEESSPVEIVRVTPKRIWREVASLRWLKKNGDAYDTIVCGTWYPEGLLAILSGFKNVCILLHGTEILPAPSFLKEWIWKPLRKWVLSKAKINVANSEFTGELGKQSASEAQITHLPLAIDIERFAHAQPHRKFGPFSEENPLTILTVSRLQEYKGFDTVIEALTKLPQDLRRMVKYRIVGRGPYFPELQNLMLINNLQDCIELMGPTSEEDLLQMYLQADLFVMCSRLSLKTQDVEGFGLVFLEAQACGTPVIGTRSGGIPSAIRQGEGAWLIQEKGSDELRSIIEKILQHPELLQEQSSLAYQVVRSRNQFSQYTSSLKNIIDGASNDR